MNVNLQIENLSSEILYAIAAVVSSIAAYSVRKQRYRKTTKPKEIENDEDSRI